MLSFQKVRSVDLSCNDIGHHLGYKIGATLRDQTSKHFQWIDLT